MPEIVTCQCGAQIRVPEAAEGRAFRCPKCKADLIAVGNSVMVASTLAHGAAVGAACPICQTAIAESEAVVSCPDCDQVHHRECWAEVGGCGTYGCKQAPALKKLEPEVNAPRAAWGDTKKCPACGESIKAIALRCRYCGTDFNTVDPLTVQDLHGQAQREESRRQTQVVLAVLFALSILSCLAAPLMLIVDLAWVVPRRREIARAGPWCLVLGYSAIALTVLYSMLILLFWLFSRL